MFNIKKNNYKVMQTHIKSSQSISFKSRQEMALIFNIYSISSYLEKLFLIINIRIDRSIKIFL